MLLPSPKSESAHREEKPEASGGVHVAHEDMTQFRPQPSPELVDRGLCTAAWPGHRLQAPEGSLTALGHWGAAGAELREHRGPEERWWSDRSARPVGEEAGYPAFRGQVERSDCEILLRFPEATNF